MPVYQVNEHEILHEEAGMEHAESEIYNGTIYLSDRRLIFEKKGKRGLVRASPPQALLDIYLYEITNVSSAVPKIKVFTKKVLTVEYRHEDETGKARFRLTDPTKWENEIRKWISDAKKQEEERQHREQEELYRKNVEMARAKAGTTNVGVAYYGNPKNTSKSSSSQNKEDIIEGDYNSTSIQVQRSSPPLNVSTKTCKSCGEPLKPGMKYCPYCGEPVK
jgi:hypothetical protein